MSLQSVNLLPQDLRQPIDWFDARNIALAAVLMVCGLAAFTAWDAWQLHELSERERQIAAQLSEIHPHGGQDSEAPLENLRAEIARLEGKLQTQGTHLDELGLGGGFSRYLFGLARVPSGELWLEEIRIEPGRVVLSGKLQSQRALPRYLKELGDAAEFQGITFPNISVAAVTSADADQSAALHFEVASSGLDSGRGEP